MNKSSSVKRIGIITNYRHVFGRDLINAVMDYKFRSASTRWDIVYIADWQEFSFDDLKRAKLDGLIAPIYNQVERFRALNIAIVNTTEPLEDCPFPTVTVDNTAVGELAAKCFAEMGLRHCYWIRSQARPAAARNRAFVSFLQEKRVTCDELRVRPVIGAADRFMAGETLRTLDVDPITISDVPVGIFCTRDVFGVEILETCQSRGWKVPDQVAVLAVDNSELLCHVASPELSSIHLSFGEAGKQAATKIDLLLQGKILDEPSMLIPPQGVVGRHSTDRIDCSDPYVAEALRYIRAHINLYFDVSDILRNTDISRRTLEKRFREHVGESIHSSIVSERLNRAEKLLSDTDLTQYEIALQSGFPNLHAFHTAFNRKHDQTPASYRVDSVQQHSNDRGA